MIIGHFRGFLGQGRKSSLSSCDFIVFCGLPPREGKASPRPWVPATSIAHPHPHSRTYTRTCVPTHWLTPFGTGGACRPPADTNRQSASRPPSVPVSQPPMQSCCMGRAAGGVKLAPWHVGIVGKIAASCTVHHQRGPAESHNPYPSGA